MDETVQIRGIYPLKIENFLKEQLLLLEEFFNALPSETSYQDEFSLYMRLEIRISKHTETVLIENMQERIFVEAPKSPPLRMSNKNMIKVETIQAQLNEFKVHPLPTGFTTLFIESGYIINPPINPFCYQFAGADILFFPDESKILIIYDSSWTLYVNNLLTHLLKVTRNQTSIQAFLFTVHEETTNSHTFQMITPVTSLNFLMAQNECLKKYFTEGQQFKNEFSLLMHFTLSFDSKNEAVFLSLLHEHVFVEGNVKS